MSSPLRIAMFVGTFPVVSETFIARQIAALLELGHEVDIYADCRGDRGSPVPPEVARHRLLERATFMDMPPETAPWEMPVWPITGRTWPPGATRSVPNTVRIARALPKLLRCLALAPRLTLQSVRSAEYRYQAASLSVLHRLNALTSVAKRYDVLHAHFGPVGNSYRFVRRLLGAPLVVSFHGHDFSTLPRKEGAGMYGKLFQTADAVTVNSSYTKKRVEQLGCPPSRLHRIPVGLDPGQFPFRERRKRPEEPARVLSVGRLVEIKGHEYLIRAAAELRENHRDVRVGIVGDGPLRNHLEQLIAQLGVQPIVTLHGALDSVAVERLMSESHIFVLASVSVDGDQEGQGLVLQEAQASGLPVVATDHGALPEGFLPGESGYLVPERDANALADRLEYLIEHSDEWPSLGRHGREFVESRFNIRDLSIRLTELYRRLIQSSQAGPCPMAS